MSVLIYPLNTSLYINLTNRCTCRCLFCPLGTNEPLEVQNIDLTLKKEPTSKEILKEIESYLKEKTRPDEVVFCGYGEPTLRLKEIKEISTELKKQNFKIRLNTNGHGSLIHKRNIVPELEGLIDEIRISLNGTTSEEYKKLNLPLYRQDTYPLVNEFVLESKKVIPKVFVSAVLVEQLDVTELKRIAREDLGVPLLLRELDQQGVSQMKNLVQ